MIWFQRTPKISAGPEPFTATGYTDADGSCHVSISDPTRVGSFKYTLNKKGESELILAFLNTAPPTPTPAPSAWPPPAQRHR